jgi:hypothetical protein
LNHKLTPHSMINGNACFAYFNKIWGIPLAVNRYCLGMHSRNLLRISERQRVGSALS